MRYRTVREMSRSTGNAFADLRNLSEALRLLRVRPEATPMKRAFGTSLSSPGTGEPDGRAGRDVVSRASAPSLPRDVERAVFEVARSGGMRAEAADHFVRHLRAARARASMMGRESSEARAVRERAEWEVRRREREAAERRRALSEALIPQALWRANFDTTEWGGRLRVDERNAKAHHWARELAERWHAGHKGLTLHGPSGCGKTYLAAAVMVSVVVANGRGIRARMVTERDLLRFFRQSYGRQADDPYTPSTVEVSEHFVHRPELLVLDDFGAEEPSMGEKGDWARGQIMDLIEHRYRERKTTLVTTNLTEAEIERRYDNRILSRLTGWSPWLSMSGNDFRQTVMPDSDDPFAGEDLVVLFNG